MIAADWGQGCLEAQPVPDYISRKAARKQVNKFRRLVKHALVGLMETVSLAIMVGASTILHTPVGTYLILVGLFMGVIGLAIFDVWRV
jgi:hypothetical protein